MQTWIIAGILLVIGGIAFISSHFSRKYVVKHKLKKATGKRISDFVDGDVAKVVGKVEYAGEPLTAPLSGRKCAYYYVLIEQLISTGKSSHWKKIIEEEKAGTFVIKDGVRFAHINCDHVKSYIVQDRIYKSGFMNDATEVLERFLSKHGYKSENLLGMNKKLRYKEGVLEKGELIAVIGKGTWRYSSQVGLPDYYERVLDVGSTENEPVYLSDDPETVKNMNY